VDRLFLDANILFSASWRADAGVAALWSIENAMLFASPFVIEEAKRNLAKREQKKRLEELIQPLHLVQAAVVPEAMRREVELPEKDWPVLAGALAADATHLITGDLRHFGRYFGRQIQGILVLPPADYIIASRRAR
jgi:predicted nucleic acid-binding protein